jgi:hypothetical protein
MMFDDEKRAAAGKLIGLLPQVHERLIVECNGDEGGCYKFTIWPRGGGEVMWNREVSRWRKSSPSSARQGHWRGGEDHSLLVSAPDLPGSQPRRARQPAPPNARAAARRGKSAPADRALTLCAAPSELRRQ